MTFTTAGFFFSIKNVIRIFVRTQFKPQIISVNTDILAVLVLKVYENETSLNIIFSSIILTILYLITGAL